MVKTFLLEIVSSEIGILLPLFSIELSGEETLVEVYYNQ